MEPWPGRKRPWEEQSPVDHPQEKRRASLKPPFSHQSPMHIPPPAGSYSRQSRILSPRQLPPLDIPSGDQPTEPITSYSPDVPSATASEAASSDPQRPTSRSLYNRFQHPDWQGQQQSPTEHSITFARTFSPNSSSPPKTIAGKRPSFGTETTPRGARLVNCCPINCRGQGCSNARKLMSKLATDLSILDSKVRIITRMEHPLTNVLPQSNHFSNQESLQWLLDLVHRTNRALVKYIERQPPQHIETPLGSDASPNMRRGQHHLEEREEPPIRKQRSFNLENPPFNHLGTMMEDRRRNSSGSEPARTGHFLHHASLASESVFGSSNSPKQTPQHTPSAILPSPSSLSFVNAQNLPSISPPLTSIPISAQNAHLQDLQHQVSVKTLALQTLQREYDSLLQTLERQKVKCATLEKKFQVSDVEINSLTDEKEKLQAQVIVLENQVEELRQGRDEARQQSVANGAQYMRIMEMANRLQIQGAEGKKKWEAERKELEKRIQFLEKAMTTRIDNPTTDVGGQSQNMPGPSSVASAHDASLSSPSQADTINILRSEVSRLRSRTQTLEKGLESMRLEGVSIQAATRHLLESGDRLEKAARDAREADG